MQRIKHLFIVSGFRLGDTNNGQSRTAEAGDAEANMRNGLFGCMVVACVGMVPAACDKLDPGCTAGVTLAGAPWLAAVCAEDDKAPPPPVIDGNNVPDGGCVGELCKPQPDMAEPVPLNPDFPPGMNVTPFTKTEQILFSDGWYDGGNIVFGHQINDVPAPFRFVWTGQAGNLPADDFSCADENCWHNCGASNIPGSKVWCYHLYLEDDQHAFIEVYPPGVNPMPLKSVQPNRKIELIRADWHP